jgi:hypothetical protein
MIHLALDSEQLRSSMSLWREAMAMSRPSHVEPHILLRRAEMLSNFAHTLAGWLMVLKACSAVDGQKASLEALSADVTRFKAWADEGLCATQIMIQEERL